METKVQKPKIAIVGYGQFGRFAAKHLRPHAQIVPIHRDTPAEKIAECQIIIFSVSWSGLEPVILRLKNHIAPSALIVDVMSVKQKPLALLKKHFKHNEILGTHPIFGPQSGKKGVAGLPIVLCNVSFSKKHYAQTKRFLKQTLELKVIEKSPKEHDQDMAEVQGLTHLIGRALKRMDIKRHNTSTKSYQHLLELVELIGEDTWELFHTIQTTNPEATKARKKFVKEITTLEQQLEK